jgi:hypothetical protein
MQWHILHKPRFKHCARCRHTRYCTVECQKADWTRHKAVCVALKTARRELGSQIPDSKLVQDMIAKQVMQLATHPIGSGTWLALVKQCVGRPRRDGVCIILLQPKTAGAATDRPPVVDDACVQFRPSCRGIHHTEGKMKQVPGYVHVIVQQQVPFVSNMTINGHMEQVRMSMHMGHVYIPEHALWPSE